MQREWTYIALRAFAESDSNVSKVSSSSLKASKLHCVAYGTDPAELMQKMRLMQKMCLGIDL